mmetsp:Transcript_30638/g.64831  ORF Transcript_30638/g.64831 Transcript_30638/m.64831 type:complete len:282 (-) Transcript_30638:108-953(-)
MLNIGVVFHRCLQMITSDEPTKYPTLFHWRNAASHRSTMKQSMTTLYNNLIEMSKGDNESNVESVELINCCPSPAEPETRRSSRHQPDTPSIRMPCGAGISGYTPGKGESVIAPSAQFVNRCINCEGKYPARKIDEVDLAGNKDSSIKKKDNRQKCHFCKAKTINFCFGCRRYLCSMPPQKGMDREGNKYPKHFNVFVPKLEADGSIKRDGDKKVIFEEEFGELSCWHIAHRNRWKKGNTTTKALTPITEESGDGDPGSEESEVMIINAKSKKKRKSTSKK